MRLDQCPGVSWSGTNHPTTDGRCVCVPPPSLKIHQTAFPALYRRASESSVPDGSSLCHCSVASLQVRRLALQMRLNKLEPLPLSVASKSNPGSSPANLCLC
ncbi:hypothetical protein CgunFtcFv8_022070 [Champsocephalus gunnari]|uniref:Uncharacterized protein n=1 Tax=Champsocephalus gunnari TaxID=52237 RepID=A0AAN8DYC0_CHAGU|nr:hypothetical protein CgunFtcFv8_022070 [Champsocephalus gunnari]